LHDPPAYHHSIIRLLQLSRLFITGKAGKSIPDFISKDKRSQNKISVIIPARNEEENIGNFYKQWISKHIQESYLK
jgi:cellulose synthase/poly-beta-1,6-N-acetylglucosamine synthase-like glycosyltransferase